MDVGESHHWLLHRATSMLRPSVNLHLTYFFGRYAVQMPTPVTALRMIYHPPKGGVADLSQVVLEGACSALELCVWAFCPSDLATQPTLSSEERHASGRSVQTAATVPLVHPICNLLMQFVLGQIRLPPMTLQCLCPCPLSAGHLRMSRRSTCPPATGHIPRHAPANIVRDPAAFALPAQQMMSYMNTAAARTL